MKVMIARDAVRLFAPECKANRMPGDAPRCRLTLGRAVKHTARDCCIYPSPKRACWRMDTAITYSFWGLGMLALGGIVLAALVW